MSAAEAPRRTEATIEGFEDEDMELQAALQASLAGPEQHFLPGGVFGPAPTTMTASAAREPTFASIPDPISVRSRPSANYPPPVIPTRHGYELLGREDDEDEDTEPPAPAVPLDPVQASIARNRAIMERMQREQEEALRFNYDDEVQRIESVWRGQQSGGVRGAEGRYNLRRQFPAIESGEDDEAEMFRRAIAESAAMAARGTNVNVAPQVEEDEEDEDYVLPPPPARTHQQTSIPAFASSAMERVYDDDDAELQAALRASLESMPEGFRIPSPPPVRLPNREYPPPPVPAAAPPSVPAPLARIQTSPPRAAPVIPPPPEDMDDEQSESDSYITAESSPVVEQLSMEEIRRRRLARFGG